MSEPVREAKDTVRDNRHKFIKNNHYFTICIYIFLLVVLSAIAIKAIFSF